MAKMGSYTGRVASRPIPYEGPLADLEDEFGGPFHNTYKQSSKLGRILEPLRLTFNRRLRKEM